MARLSVGLMAVVLGAACVVSSPNKAKPLIVPDVVGSSDAAVSGVVYVPCDRERGDDDCAAGEFCDTQHQVCVACVGTAHRCVGTERERCEPVSLDDDGQLTGGVFEPEPCGIIDVCVPVATGQVACETQICIPGQSRCKDPQTAEGCNTYGTGWDDKPCLSGKACYSGACDPIRHNVLLIFDTSGSMHQYIDVAEYPGNCQSLGLPCLEEWPECDAGNKPLTLISLAKKVFADKIAKLVDGNAQFALQRFPQREALNQWPQCAFGLYSPLSRITGDDDAFDTEAGTWFEDGISQVLSVGFPVRLDKDNTKDLLAWMDGHEQVGPTTVSCTQDGDCPSGLCGTVGAKRRCFYHQEPELRAGGETPLGKSLFYAGEYFRRYVSLDGKPCEKDEDCKSAGYVCSSEGMCEDPYGHCRDNHIILFTDGIQNPTRATSDFFNPVNQAKRLAFGLACSKDEDCRGGASCEQGLCVPPGGSVETTLPFGWLGFNALETPGGRPLSIRTTVVNFQAHGPASNAEIAKAGGGALLDVDATDEAAFAQAVGTLLQYDLKCQPVDLDRGIEPGSD